MKLICRKYMLFSRVVLLVINWLKYFNLAVERMMKTLLIICRIPVEESSLTAAGTQAKIFTWLLSVEAIAIG